MRLNILAAIVAMMLFLAYFSPIIIKLKEMPLAIVVLGGAVLVAVDIWESLKN